MVSLVRNQAEERGTDAARLPFGLLPFESLGEPTEEVVNDLIDRHHTGWASVQCGPAEKQNVVNDPSERALTLRGSLSELPVVSSALERESIVRDRGEVTSPVGKGLHARGIEKAK